jgi:hypothetical protein
MGLSFRPVTTEYNHYIYISLVRQVGSFLAKGKLAHTTQVGVEKDRMGDLVILDFVLSIAFDARIAFSILTQKFHTFQVQHH